MNGFTKAQYEHNYYQRLYAFKKIADALGKEHAITKMMGQLAWSRHDHEPGIQPTKDSYVFATGVLTGAFDTLNRWARENDYSAQRKMLDIWPRSWAAPPPERASGETV